MVPQSYLPLDPLLELEPQEQWHPRTYFNRNLEDPGLACLVLGVVCKEVEQDSALDSAVVVVVGII